MLISKYRCRVPNIYVCIGHSKCGKTEWAKKFKEENPKAVEICRDDFRYNPEYQSEYIEKGENFITYLAHKKFFKAISDGHDVIISDTNLSNKIRNKWLRFSRDYTLNLHFVVFHTAFQEAFFGNHSNLLSMSDYTLTVQYRRFKEFLAEPPIHDVNYIVL